MRLEHIEITGFKSFAKKSKLSFETAVTAVVGPNGSGKSNVVEAFRFVLGEQSMKSMRGKSGSDLIFRGSNSSSSLSRAAVSITFDNSDNIFGASSLDVGETADEKENKNNPAFFEKITFTREIFADGTSKYLMNGSEIRLKQMLSLLASVNIGASSHHIISQGEADSILRASTRERREILEEALGLKIYHYKIKESESKLAKSVHALEDVQALRRELAPHLKFLASQVQKIEKGRTIRAELEELLLRYLSTEQEKIEKEEIRIRDLSDLLNKKISGIEDALSQIKKVDMSDSHFAQEIEEKKKALQELRVRRRENENQIGRLEGMIEVERRMLRDRKQLTKDEPTISFSPVEYDRILADLDYFVKKIRSSQNLDEVLDIATQIDSIISRLRERGPELTEKDIDEEATPIDHLNEIALELESLQKKLAPILEEETKIQSDLDSLEHKRDEQRREEQNANATRYEKQRELTEHKAELHILESGRTIFLERKERFETELKEAGFLFGPQFLHQLKTISVDHDLNIAEAKRNIDRLKIRLDEHAGISNEVVNEHRSAVERDNFLSREVSDIENSIHNLETLIIELKTMLDQKFTIGVKKINERFSEFFKTMFDGGGAFLSIIVEKKRKKKGEEEMIEEEDDESRFLERGVEVHVNLPEKKVKELTMLSGGERSLVSIALLFAISQVNPPPFLVLDETDAALDEANSRRYGDMIERLSEYSQLIVVTHNRETMSRASVLYGVTLGADGGSKLLSIKFDEAVKVAK